MNVNVGMSREAAVFVEGNVVTLIVTWEKPSDTEADILNEFLVRKIGEELTDAGVPFVHQHEVTFNE